MHDLVEERLVADLQEPRRLRAVPVHPIEHFLDRHALGVASGLARDVLQADRGVGAGAGVQRRGAGPQRRPGAAAQVGDDLDVHGPRAAEHHDALDGVLELADVAGPLVVDERAQRLGRHLDGAAVLHVELAQEVIDEHRDLLPTLAERRDADLDDVETVVEVLAELMDAHRGLEVAVGGGDQAHVGVDDLLAADAGELAVLQHVEQLGLQPQRHLADLVQEERALVSRFELAWLLPIGARKRALLVTEELGFQQLAGQRGAIDLQELLGRARRGLVNRPRHDLFAHAALSAQQDRRVRGRHLADQVTDRLHLPTAAKGQERVTHVRRLSPLGSVMNLSLPVMHRAAGDVPNCYPPCTSSDYKQFCTVMVTYHPGVL